MVAARVPAARVPAARVPAARVPAVRVPAVRVPAVRVPAVRVPAADDDHRLGGGAAGSSPFPGSGTSDKPIEPDPYLGTYPWAGGLSG